MYHYFLSRNNNNNNIFHRVKGRRSSPPLWIRHWLDLCIKRISRV